MHVVMHAISQSLPFFVYTIIRTSCSGDRASWNDRQVAAEGN